MKKLWLLLFLLTLSFGSQARVFQVFGIDQDISLGLENETLVKNYYVNIGSNQGIQKGATLNVFRNINKFNPYENKKRANYHVKIGELKVIHTEGEIAIAILQDLKTSEVDLAVDVNSLMIGDQVMIKINN